MNTGLVMALEGRRLKTCSARSDGSGPVACDAGAGAAGAGDPLSVGGAGDGLAPADGVGAPEGGVDTVPAVCWHAPASSKSVRAMTAIFISVILSLYLFHRQITFIPSADPRLAFMRYPWHNLYGFPPHGISAHLL